MKKEKLDPEVLAVLEQEIKGTVLGIRKLLSCGIKRRTLCLLINDALPQTRRIGISAVEDILTAMEQLDVIHLKKKI